MPQEPETKNTIVFIDGQNLYGAAKNAFGYSWPNYDVGKLAAAVCASKGWNLKKVCFYSGIPDATDNQRWHDFWTRKLTVMGSRGIQIYSRKLKYRNQTFKLPDGTEHTILVGQEKGVDIRIALDVVNAAVTRACDVAVVFSQDQDLSEVADEVRRIAVSSNRWFKIASAYPVSPASKNKRGINDTDWIQIDRATYDACLDPTDYRKPLASKP